MSYTIKTTPKNALPVGNFCNLVVTIFFNKNVMIVKRAATYNHFVVQMD